MKHSKSAGSTNFRGLFVAILLFVVIGCFFWKCFLPEFVLFSNDGPLGLQKAAWLRLPQAFVGQWFDLNTLGANADAAFMDPSTVIRWGLGPVGYSKFVIPISIWFLGVAAYFCFRRFGMSTVSSIVGGLAAAFVTGFFTNACWGAAPPVIGFGMNYLALGALAKRDKLPFWIAPALAGMAIGINVMEAADIGALFSMLIAAFVVYQSLFQDGAPVASRALWGVGRAIIVAVAAFFIASYAVSALVAGNITGIVGTKQDEQSRAAHWDFATSWSMPITETPALFIPNLYGCNVIAPGAANYWGGLGRDPEWDRWFASDRQGPPPQPGHFLRHTGRGIYLGCFVVFIAVWGVLQSFRKRNSVFTPLERRLIWFWFAAAFISLLLAYGRFAPFYRLVYTLPYFSTIRNPDKFLHIVTFTTIILFAYGIHGLHRRYLDVPLVNSPGGRFKAWWTKASGFDKGWVVGCVFAIFLAFAGWALYAGMRGQVENHLVELQRAEALQGGGQMDAKALQSAHDFAAAQVSLSLQQVGWFILFLIIGSCLVVMILTGAFAGSRAIWAGIILGAIVVGDLGRANLPYIVYWNYKEKYQVGNPEPIIKFLSSQPGQERAAYLLPKPFLRTPPQFGQFQTLYDIEWTQQLFPFYNILTPDIVQMPRMAQNLETFNETMRPQLEIDAKGEPIGIDDKSYYRVGRNWQLNATRYLVGPAPFLNIINQQFDTVSNRFRIIQRFDLGPRPGVDRPVQWSQIEAAPTDDPNAPYALYEYTGALPRAGLFSNWQVDTNDQHALEQLASREFDPAKLVILPAPIAGVTPSGTNQGVVPAKFISYEPANIKLDATPTSPSVLMMCDKYDADWKVWVDGKPAQVLRCDYLMRGVFLTPGHHEVVFKFRPSIKMLYVNIAAIFLGLCMLGYAMAATHKQREE